MICFSPCRLDKRLGLEFGQVRVNSDGVVNTKFLGLLTTQCAMNSAHFPFDYQLCAFLLGSEIYSPKEVAMEIKSVVQLESSKNNPNWNLDNVRKIAEPPITGRFNIVFNGSRCIWGFFIWYRLSCTLSLSLSRTLFRVKLERRSPSECLCSYPSWSSCCSWTEICLKCQQQFQHWVNTWIIILKDTMLKIVGNRRKFSSWLNITSFFSFINIIFNPPKNDQSL